MKRFDKVKVGDLNKNDSFYFPMDKTKSVWLVSRASFGVEHVRTKVKKKSSIEEKSLQPWTEVIFLRGDQ
jgi:hypothetical protein